MKVSAILLAFAFVLASCSSVDTHLAPKADLSHLKRFYVEHRLTDDHHIDDAIVAELQARGREASAGPLTMMPDGVEAIVTYEDTWTWDFRSYLLRLKIDVRHANTDKPLASGSYEQPTPVPKSPPAVVHKIFASMFK